jgi:hypothetical protein
MFSGMRFGWNPQGRAGLHHALYRFAVRVAELQCAVGEHVAHVIRRGVQRIALARLEAYLKDPRAFALTA